MQRHPVPARSLSEPLRARGDRGAAALGYGIALMLIGLVAAGCGANSAPSLADARPAFSPSQETDRAGRSPADPKRLAPGAFATARVRRQTALRAKPRGRVVQRLGRRTEFGSPRVLAVVRRRGAWLEVLAAELRNGQRGWVRADAVELGSTPWSVHVDRSARRLVVKRAGRRRWSIPVAVGRPANPTPLGRFAVTDKLSPNRPASPYGCCILALTGHQTKLVPGWPGGDRLAIHATPQTSSIGQAASLGCLRAHTPAMRKLMKRVPLGSPVFIRR